jgi:hypothetical protein
VSFAIEERNPNWGKRSAFYSVTASRDPAGAEGGTALGWGANDLKVVRCLLCKHVVTATYDDAVKRKIMTVAQAREEVVGIVAAYDTQIVKHLSATNGD